MNIKTFICVLLGLLCAQADIEPVKKGCIPRYCSAKPETGFCKAAIPRYYYNPSSGTCETFIWGGCGGNSNNFLTKTECLKTCAPHCFLEPETGPCKALFKRYYYNTETETCEQFTYGGCQGNKNNFETKSQCLKTCAPECSQEPDSGLCKAYMPHYYYDPTDRTCKQFIYGGCGGNKNRFQTKTACIQRCASHCPFPLDPGPCDGAFVRYFYNSTSESCEKFTYGGCQGNANNFETETKCRDSCGTTCYQDPETGLCGGAFTRYYYNFNNGQCETFSYGGCGGNDNNFQTEEECRGTCGTP